jgi:hypothetical protein
MGLAAGLVLGADPQFSYEASIRGELRVGTALPFAFNGAVGTELGAFPSLTLSYSHSSEYLFSLQYDPQLLLPLNVSGVGVEALQRAKALADWSSSTGARHYIVSEDFQYGITDFISLASTTGTLTPQLQPLPVVTRLRYVYSNSKAELAFRLAPTLQLRVIAGYQLSGGADRVAELQIPLQQGPYAEMVLHHTLSRFDSLETDVLLSQTSFSPIGSSIFLGGVTEGWIRRLTRYFHLQLAGGISAALDSPAPNVPYSFEMFPILRATGTEERPTSRSYTLSGSLMLELAPYIDRISGAAYERSQALLSVDWSAPRGFGARVQGGYARPLYGNLRGATAVELVGATIGYQPELFLRFELGISGVWQQPLPGVPAPSTFQWLGLAGIVLRTGGPL